MFLEEQIFAVFGVPESLMTDNGKQFLSKEFRKFLNSYGVTHVKTAAYSPQANASERVNRSVLAAIRSYLEKDQRHWDRHLSSIGSALRTTIHSAIGMSPYEALFGQCKIEHGTDYHLLKCLKSVNNPEFQLLPKPSRMNVIHTHLKQSLQRAHQDYENRYNTRNTEVKFRVGDEAFKRNFALSDATKRISAMLCPKFIKVRVKAICSNNLYELEDLRGQPMGVFHAKDIRR